MNETEDFVMCNNGKRIHSFLKDDLFADCGPDGEDEPKLLALLLNGTENLCSSPEQLPCREGHPACHNVADICNYLFSKHGRLVPCSNGGHLQNCEHFQCNQKFKCPLSYCISWNMVSDGKWDCPEGNDESDICITFSHCLKMYKCKSTNYICIHLGNVCDGMRNCPLSDDEILC